MTEPTTEMKIRFIKERLEELNEKSKKSDLTDNEREKVQDIILILEQILGNLRERL